MAIAVLLCLGWARGRMCRCCCACRRSARAGSSSPTRATCGAWAEAAATLPADQRRRHRDRSRLFAGRLPDRLHRAVRRQHRRLCDAGGRRRAEAADLPSRAGRRGRLDARTASGSSSAPTATAYSRFPRLFTIGKEGGIRPRRCRCRWARRLLLARRRTWPMCRPRLGAGLEALSWWADHADLDRRPRRLPYREDPARELQRLQPDVGRRTRSTSSPTATAPSLFSPTTPAPKRCGS